MNNKTIIFSAVIASIFFHSNVRPDAQRRKLAFSQIYQTNFWNGDESISGPGSTLKVTRTLQFMLPHIMELLQINSLLDAACGDCNWMLSLKLPISHYTGTDIVEDLINKNRQRYGNAEHTFICLDIAKDPLPRADAIICRDCLAHLSYDEIQETIANFKKSGATYLLATSYPIKENKRDIRSGGFRPVNLQIAPFNLPEPIMAFDELSAEPEMKSARKRMCVWQLDDIKFN